MTPREGRRAIRQMNRIHGRFEISNEDFLYVLSSFVFEPIRWNARFGWRPLIETRRSWPRSSTGVRSGDGWLSATFPRRPADFERFNEEYERRELPTHRRRRAGSALRLETCSWRGSPACRSASARRPSTR